MKTDNLDLMILSELSRDASMSIPKMAEKIKVNSSVVYSRIKRLVKVGLIERYTIVVNDQKLGYHVKALVGLKMDVKKRDSIINALFDIHEVREIAEVTGRFDIFVTVYAHTLKEIHGIVSNHISKVDGVLSSESFIEMKAREKAMPYMPSK